MEFSHGELWSFHSANCRVFIRRIVGNGRYSPHYTLPLHRITRVRLKTTKHTKHRRSGIIWRAVAPFHEMMIFNPFVPIRVHSWFWVLFVYFVPIRGSVFSFRVFRVFRGSTHSWPFVVPRPVSAKNFPGNVGDDLFSVDLFLQLLLETKSYR